MCCGLTMEEIPELHIGSLKERSIKQLIDDSPNDLLKIWIHLDGPMSVLRYVKSQIPDFVIPSDKAHICDQCRFLYKSPEVKRVLMGGLPPNAQSLMQRYK